MLPHDCQIITDDMLLTSSHLHVALHIGSLAPWRRGLSGSALTICTLGVWGRGDECLQGAITALAQRAPSQPCHVASAPLRLFPLSPSSLFSVRWCAHRQTNNQKIRSVCIRSTNAGCQLAVPAVSVEILPSADVPSVWQRVASSSILKGLPWPWGR